MMSQVSLFIFGSVVFFIAVYGAFIYLVQQAQGWGERDCYEDTFYDGHLRRLQGTPNAGQFADGRTFIADSDGVILEGQGER